MKKMMMLITMLFMVVICNAQVITDMATEDGHRVIYLSNGQKIDGRLIPNSNCLRRGETIDAGLLRLAMDRYAAEVAPYQMPVGGYYGYPVGIYGGGVYGGGVGVSVNTKHGGASVYIPVSGNTYGYTPQAGVAVRAGSTNVTTTLPVSVAKKNKNNTNSTQRVVVVDSSKTAQQTTTTGVREININDLMRGF